MAFRKVWLWESQCLNSSQSITSGFQCSFQWTVTSTMHFQPHKVVDNSVNDSLCLRTQLFVFCHQGHLGKEQPVFAFTHTFYYYVHTHVISCVGRFFMPFGYEILHFTCCKFNTGICNELTSQCECTIEDNGCKPWVIYLSIVPHTLVVRTQITLTILIYFSTLMISTIRLEPDCFGTRKMILNVYIIRWILLYNSSINNEHFLMDISTSSGLLQDRECSMH